MFDFNPPKFTGVQEANICKLEDVDFRRRRMEIGTEDGNVEESGKLNKVKESGKLNKVKESGKLNKIEESGKLNKVEESGKLNKVKESGKLNGVKESGKLSRVKDSGKLSTIHERGMAARFNYIEEDRGRKIDGNEGKGLDAKVVEEEIKVSAEDARKEHVKVIEDKSKVNAKDANEDQAKVVEEEVKESAKDADKEHAKVEGDKNEESAKEADEELAENIEDVSGEHEKGKLEDLNEDAKEEVKNTHFSAPEHVGKLQRTAKLLKAIIREKDCEEENGAKDVKVKEEDKGNTEKKEDVKTEDETFKEENDDKIEDLYGDRFEEDNDVRKEEREMIDDEENESLVNRKLIKLLGKSEDTLDKEDDGDNVVNEADDVNETKIQWDPGASNPVLCHAINDKIVMRSFKELRVKLLKRLQFSDTCSGDDRLKMNQNLSVDALGNNTANIVNVVSCAGCVMRNRVEGPYRWEHEFVHSHNNAQLKREARQNIARWAGTFNMYTACPECMRALFDIMIVMLNAR